jgi:hypothetical protein
MGIRDKADREASTVDLSVEVASGDDQLNLKLQAEGQPYDLVALGGVGSERSVMTG